MTKSLQSAADRVIIGRIGAPHGVSGELRVSPLTDFPDRFEELEEVFAGDELLHVDSVRYFKKSVLLKFREYQVREEAAKLTGKALTVDRSQAAPLDEGEYYAFDIIGLHVFDGDGTELGTVTDVLKTGSNDVYLTRRKDGGPDILVPALKSVVHEIDLAGGRMVVKLPEELA